ncbi:MAG: HD domain-containing protein [Anaerolineae bacterium]|nr:HD domain-containing protein [Anaerolineae bacterium]
MAKKTAEKGWRKVVQRAMQEAAKEEALRRLGTPEPGFNYRWEHVRTVVRLAVRLATLTGADKDIVEAAAWLHDIAKDKGAKHPAEGAKIARKLLPKTDFPPDKIEPVAQAIAQHTGLWRDTPLTNLEAMVLWDADKLAKLGLTAAFHWTAMFVQDGVNRTSRDLIRRGRLTKWQSHTVASMHTEPARRAAAERLKRYQQLWDTLECELNGEDLQL